MGMLGVFFLAFAIGFISFQMSVGVLGIMPFKIEDSVVMALSIAGMARSVWNLFLL